MTGTGSARGKKDMPLEESGEKAFEMHLRVGSKARILQKE